MGVGCEKEKNSSLSFSGGSLEKNPPANAGDTGSIPDQGRSRMLQLLKPECARARAPQQEKPPQREARTLQERVRSPCSSQVEKSLYSNEDSAQPEISKIIKKKKKAAAGIWKLT